MGSLSNLYISQSYQSLIHLETNNTASTNFIQLEDGLGNGLGVYVNTLGQISASGNIYGLNITGSGGGGNVDTSSLVTTASFNAYTSSTNSRLNSIQSFTASISTSVGLLQTFSASQYKADSASFSSRINAVDDNLVTTASFNAYTSSNDTKVNNLNTISASYLSFTQSYYSDSSSFSSRIDAINDDLVTTASFNQYTQSTNNRLDSLESKTGSYATTGSNTFVGDQTINGNISASGWISASSIVADNATITYLHTVYETSSVIYSSGSNQLGDELTDEQILSGSVKVVGGLTLNGTSVVVTTDLLPLNQFTASQEVSNSYFATTGSNTFKGQQTLSDNDLLNQITLDDYSGSLVLFGKSFSSSSTSLNHISASAGATSSNLIFKNSDSTGRLEVSGSGNIFVNPAAADSLMKRALAGKGNISLNESGFASVSQSSYTTSDNRLSTNYNVFLNQANFRLPISSSNTFTFDRNVVIGSPSFGVGAATNLTRLLGAGSVTNNAIIGTFGTRTTINDISGTFTVLGNALINTPTFIQASGSFQISNNFLGSAGTITNGTQLLGGETATNARLSFTSNIINGTTINVTSSGSNSTNSELRGFDNSLAIGNNNSVGLVLNGASASVDSTIIAGHGLIVTGSSRNNSGAFVRGGFNGSGFFGRWNDITGNKARTVETVFAVGTGTSTSARKTGFYIDSGSNAYVEGTFNVIGEATITGSLGVSSTINTLTVGLGGGNVSGNTVVGSNALANNTTANNVIAIGANASANTSGSGAVNNVAIGQGALEYNEGFNQVAIGGGALRFNSTGNFNLAIGAGAMEYNDFGANNIAIGANTMQNAYGSNNNQNLAIGASALKANTGEQSVAIGYASLEKNTTGNRNVGLGINSLYNNTTGTYNVGIGGFTMALSQTSQNNIAIGYASMENAESNTHNVGIGVASLYRARANSNYNVAIGGNSLREHYHGDISGGLNMAIGYDSMANVRSGSGNTAIGVNTLENAFRANDNIFIGTDAGMNATTSSTGNSIDNNVVIGSKAGTGLRGNSNVAIGSYTLRNHTSGAQNTVIGSNAGESLLSGSYNTLIGAYLTGSSFWNNVIAISEGTGTIKAFYSASNWDLYANTDISGALDVSGSVTIANSNGNDLYVHGHKQFNAGEFWSTITQSGSAGVSGSITFNTSGSVYGVSIVSSSQVTMANAGVYNIQFSAQIETSAGADTAYIWFKKNGSNIVDSATKVVLANNTAQVMTVNILDTAAANDYYELGYQFTNGNATILAEAASGNIPAIPSVILTVTQAR